MLARENPFRVERVLTHRYVFEDGYSLEALHEQFEKQDRRGAIVGPKGHGKTTLLEDFVQHLREAGENTKSVRFCSAKRAEAARSCQELLRSTRSNSILVIDGAEQLGWLAWRSLARESTRFRGLLITAHRSGRLRELFRCRTTPETLRQAILQIAPELVGEVREEIEPLFRRNRGNVRQCLQALYDRYSEIQK